jgi:uncharacterized membrane-anchored protein
MKKLLTVAFVLYSGFISAGITDSLQTDSTEIAAEEQMAGLDSVIQSMDFKKGSYILKSDLATITIPQGFTFLEANDAHYILTDIWGNPEDKTVLGMLVPESADLLNSDAWAIVYTYEEDGHVEDDDAEDIDYDEMLKDMQKQSREYNAERTKEGYPAVEVIGWAQKPYYDAATHKLYWAKELEFGGDSLHTLNYNIRMLGRKGVLVMNVIAGMNQLPLVNNNIKNIIASTEFNKGNRYEDFDSSSDKIAEYGIGGLIAGGVLAKTGLLAKLGLLITKIWKVVAIAAIALIGFFRNKLGSKKNKEVEPYNKDNNSNDDSSVS